MLWLLLTCSIALAEPPKVDADADGNIITVRPLEGHTVGVFDTDGSAFQLPDGMVQPMWLVHPDAWRQAVAMGEKLRASEQLVPELKLENERLQEGWDGEKRLRSGLRLDLESCEASSKTERTMLRRSRTQWAVGTGVVGVATGLFFGLFVL